MPAHAAGDTAGLENSLLILGRPSLTGADQSENRLGSSASSKADRRLTEQTSDAAAKFLPSLLLVISPSFPRKPREEEEANVFEPVGGVILLDKVRAPDRLPSANEAGTSFPHARGQNSLLLVRSLHA